MPQTILVSNRLPLSVNSGRGLATASGGLVSALAGVHIDSTWIGWPGNVAEDTSEPTASGALLAGKRFRPVLLSQHEITGYYNGFANTSLWPLLHNMVEDACFNPDWVAEYERVNRRFAEAVLDIADDGDTIWIHDFHFFILPRLLKSANRNLRIGFFLHTPFPPSDVFRRLPEHEQMLQGLLGADLLGFQTLGHLKNFRSTLLSSLGLQTQPDSVLAGDRAIRLCVCPIGHDHAGFVAAMRTEAFDHAVELYSRMVHGRRLILTVARLDPTKGILQTLAVIRSFLLSFPVQHRDIVFIIVAEPSRLGTAGYQQLSERIRETMEEINRASAVADQDSVILIDRSLPRTELAALYALADVALIVPLNDGMNLVAKEYIDCQPGIGRPGVLVLSEFAGAALELSEALIVNPHDAMESAKSVSAALAMPDAERHRRIAKMQPGLRSNHVGAWARRFLGNLYSLPDQLRPVSDLPWNELAPALICRLNAGASVAFFLDYDGTLREFTDNPGDAVPDANTLFLLSSLARNSRVHVALISGRASEFLETHFAGLGIVLVAEHGYRSLRPGCRQWECSGQPVDTSWKETVRPLLQQAVSVTPGSALEEKRTSLVWHYRRADQQFARRRARHLVGELQHVIRDLSASVVQGNQIVEVVSLGPSKGAVVRGLIEQWQPGIAVAAGDDVSDESMFETGSDPRCEFVSVRIGEGETRARYRTEIAGLRTFLECFVQGLDDTTAS